MITEKKELASVLQQFSLVEIKEKLEKWNSEIHYLLKYSFQDFLALSQSLKDYYSNLKEYYKQEFEKGIDDNQTEKKHLLSSVNQLIIELQFHDIIRQKLEHIETIQDQVVLEIVSKPDKVDFKSTDYIFILPEISLLNKNQLDSLNQEYLNATVGIQDSLNNIISIIRNNDMVGLDLTETEKHAQDFNKVVAKLTDDLNSLNVTFLKEGDLDVSELSLQKLKNVEKLYTMKSERDVFNALFFKDHQEEEDLDIELF